MMTDYPRIIRDGLWDNNIVFSQNLALCPLLAVTGTATNGLGMGLATTLVLVCSGLSIAMVRSLVSPEVRIPVFVLIIAAIVTLVDMSMNAWMHDLHKVLGLFIPLIVTNCAILGRAEAYASKHAMVPAMVDGLMMGLGFTLALMTVGAIRELLGSGTLFANAELLLGKSLAFMELTLIPGYRGFLIAILPPGGFLVLGFLLAGKRILDRRLAARRSMALTAAPLDQAATA